MSYRPAQLGGFRGYDRGRTIHALPELVAGLEFVARSACGKEPKTLSVGWIILDPSCEVTCERCLARLENRRRKEANARG